MYSGEIPFNKQGLMDYVDSRCVDWKDNFVFYGTLRFVSTRRGRSAANFGVKIVVAEEPATFLKGTEATMFMKYVLQTMKNNCIMSGNVTGRWTFYKCGSNYSIGPA